MKNESKVLAIKDILSFDLTTKEGFKKAILLFPITLLFPQVFIGKLFYDFFKKTISPKEQFKGACKIIEQGKKNDVRNMKVKVSKSVGLKIKSKFEDLPINIVAGLDDNVELDVTYK